MFPTISNALLLSTMLFLSQVSTATESSKVEQFMTEYVQAFNSADVERVSAYFSAPFLRVTAGGTEVLTTKQEVKLFLGTVIESSGLREGMYSQIQSISSCALTTNQILVNATFSRMFPNGNEVVRSFSYLLNDGRDKMQIMAMLPAPSTLPNGCSNGAYP